MSKIRIDSAKIAEHRARQIEDRRRASLAAAVQAMRPSVDFTREKR